MNKKNRYGYKVGYCKNGGRLFIRKFITHTHQQAYQMLVFYRKFGHQRVTQKFNYEIQPITKKEVLAGIWDELPFLYKCPGYYLYRWAHCSIVKTQNQREKFFGFLYKSCLLQKFLSFFVDFGRTFNSYMVCPFSLCYFGPADKGKLKYRSKGMYQENQFRTFNVWRDGDMLHVFLTVSVKKYEQYKKTIDYVKSILGMNFELDFDNDQFYFVLGDFEEYNEFKTYFYKYLCCFQKEDK